MAVAVTDGFHKYPGYECPYKYKYVKHSLLNSAVCVLLETGHAAQAWLPELSVGCWNGILGAVPASSPPPPSELAIGVLLDEVSAFLKGESPPLVTDVEEQIDFRGICFWLGLGWVLPGS